MITEKGLDAEVADKIGVYIQLNGRTELIDKLLQDDALVKLPAAVKGLADLKRLLNYCDIVGIQHDVVVDLSLARGLDYYTGAIFEAVLKGKSYHDTTIDVQESISAWFLATSSSQLSRKRYSICGTAISRCESV